MNPNGTSAEPTAEPAAAPAATEPVATEPAAATTPAADPRDAKIAELQAKLTGYQTEEQTRKNATLSEVERAKNDATAASDRATTLEAKLVKRDALDALKGANVVDADLAFLAIKDQIEIKDGEPTNIKTLVEKFVKDRPQMVKTDGAQAPPTKPTSGGGNGSESGGGSGRRTPGRI